MTSSHWNRKGRIDKWSFFDLIGYDPHDGQRLFHESRARFRVMPCGWGWGKTTGAARDYEPLFLTPGTRGWIVAPTYDLGKKPFAVFYEDLVPLLGGRNYFKQCINRPRQGIMMLQMPTINGIPGSILEVKSERNPESLEEDDVDYIIFEEAGLMKRSTFERCFGRLRMGGEACFLFTPAGYDWTAKLFERGASDEFLEWWSRRGPTSENPYIDPEFIESARRNLTPQAFEAKILARFRTSVGHVLPEFDPNVHVTHLEYDPRKPLYGAVDYGYTNPFVWLWIQVNSRDQVCVLRERYVRNVTTEDHADYMKKLSEEEGLTWKRVCDDPSGADERATLKSRGFKVFKRDCEVQVGITLIRNALELRDDGRPGMLIDPSCVGTIEDFKSWRYPETKDEAGETKEDPVKGRDHGPEAYKRFLSWHTGKRKAGDLKPAVGGKRVMTRPSITTPDQRW